VRANPGVHQLTLGHVGEYTVKQRIFDRPRLCSVLVR
jgi:hypothetical protein